MILKDGTKHACRSCITGHRSSKCVHHDRELFPIAKKGRPSTQCKACKQRGGAHAGQCECQNKRKPKSQATVVGSASGSGSGSYAEGSTSRKDSGTSQFSSVPASEHGTYSHMLGYHTGGVDGSSTHATNSSASSPSYAQQSFALNPSTDNHLLSGGLPFPQPDQHFAYGLHAHGQSEHHLDLPPPRNMAAGVVRSRPATSGEEETPWWLYRAGSSPHAGHPYEPPPPSGHPLDGHSHQTGTPGIYSDYAQYMAQPSPLTLGTPGNNASNPAAFVWHNNATSYRDYMASQQQHSNYHAPSTRHPSSQPVRMHEHNHPHAPTLHHHHSVPFTHTSAPSAPMDSAPHSAPLPASAQAHPHQQQRDNERNWRDANSDYNPYNMTFGNDRRHDVSSLHEDPHRTRIDSHTGRVPALNYDSGSSRMTSTDSLATINHLPTPISLGSISAATTSGGQQHYDSKEYSQSILPSRDASLRERRSTSFDQIVLSRASPINLKLPEDRKKRKFESER